MDEKLCKLAAQQFQTNLPKSNFTYAALFVILVMEFTVYC